MFPIGELKKMEGNQRRVGREWTELNPEKEGVDISVCSDQAGISYYYGLKTNDD